MDTKAIRAALAVPDPHRMSVQPSPWWAAQMALQTELLTYILDELRANASNRAAALADHQTQAGRPLSLKPGSRS